MEGSGGLEDLMFFCSCCLICLRSWIFSAWRFLAYSLARRPWRDCAALEAAWPSRAAFLRLYGEGGGQILLGGDVIGGSNWGV